MKLTRIHVDLCVGGIQTTKAQAAERPRRVQDLW